MKTNIQNNNNEFTEKVLDGLISMNEIVKNLLNECMTDEKLRNLCIKLQQEIDEMLDDSWEEYDEWPDDDENNE